MWIAHADVSLRLHLERQLSPARLDDTALDEHIDKIINGKNARKNLYRTFKEHH